MGRGKRSRGVSDEPGEHDYLSPETAQGHGGSMVGDVVHVYPAQPDR